MILQATDYLPGADRHIFICLKEHMQKYSLEEAIREDYPQAKIVVIDQLTEGQPCTAELGLKDENKDVPLLIAACDNGMLWNTEKYSELLADAEVDAVIWSFRNHPSSKKNPEMYGWIKVNENLDVLGVSVKKPISDKPENDHAIVGTFYFRKSEYFSGGLTTNVQEGH